MKQGPELLKQWIGRRGFSQRKAAEFLGWHESYVSLLVSGYRDLGLANAIKIERLTGIPVEAWLSSGVDDLPRSAPKRARKAKRDKTISPPDAG